MDIKALVFNLMMADTDEHDCILVTKDVREEIINTVVELYKESRKQKVQEGFVAVPFTWLVKFCTHIDFKDYKLDSEKAILWRAKLKQQFGIPEESMKWEE